MKKLLHKMAVALIGVLIAAPAFAQTYPVTNPTYIPQAVMAATTYTSTGFTTAYQINGVTTLDIGITGTFTVLSAQVQVTESRGTSPTWITLPVDSADGDRYASITATGSYRVNVSGYAQARLNIVTLTGTNVIVGYSGGVGAGVSGTYNVNKHTYNASVTALVPAASATDILTISGSATTLVKVTHLECGGQATSSGSKLIQLQQRIASDVGGTSSVVAANASDLSDPAPTAVVTSFTANPTVGTAASGVLRVGILSLPASTAVGTLPLSWDFGAQSRTTTKEVVLRGTNQVLAIHGAGASFPAGSTVNCSVEWIEE
jgi:hypothetical protein